MPDDHQPTAAARPVTAPELRFDVMATMPAAVANARLRRMDRKFNGTRRTAAEIGDMLGDNGPKIIGGASALLLALFILQAML